MKLSIGTRGSALARAQATDVARRLEAAGHETRIVIISTAGDRVTDRAFAEVGAFGVFVREIESALLDARIDVAVHSYKDLPSRSPDGLVIAAVPERVDVADVLVARRKAMAADRNDIPLRDGASVGTAAARRQALLRALRPDLAVELLRGNVPTRVRAVTDGRFDAVVLAAAGLERLGRATGDDRLVLPETVVTTRLDPEVFVPAPAQGAIAVQVRADAHAVRDAVAAIDDARSALALRAEREVLALAEGGCELPFGAWCQSDPAGTLTLIAVLGIDDTIVRATATGRDPHELAGVVWRELEASVKS